MPTKSSNTQGNPYHDEEGKFTSSDDSGEKKGEEQESSFPIPPDSPKTPKVRLKSSANLDVLRKETEERQSVGKIPYLTTSNDVIDAMESFFPKVLTDELVKHYDFSGNSSRPFDFSPFAFSNGEKGLKVNMFVQILSKYRYPQQYCDTIPLEEYNGIVELINKQGSGKFTQYYDSQKRSGNYYDLRQLAKESDIGCGFVLGYRGINFGGNDARQKLADALNSYIGYHTSNPCYGGQGCYGTVNYVAMSRNYADSYAGYSFRNGHVMKHIINVRDAKIMYEPEVELIKSELSNRSNEIQAKMETHFSKFMDSEKAKKLALGVVGSIKYDLGFTCALLGGDVLVAGIGNGNQMDILNWKIARILKDW